MPETGQPGGAGGGRSSTTQGGKMAAGGHGPFLRVLYVPATAGNVTRTLRCPLGTRWNVVSIAIAYDMDSTVADRILVAQLRDEFGAVLHSLVYSGALVADAVGEFTYGPSEVDNLTSSFPSPMVDRLQLHFQIDYGVAGDVYSARVLVLEWKP